MKLIVNPFLICFLLLSGCCIKEQNKAKRLYNKALIMTSFNPDTARVMQALELLNKATDMQPDYYIAYDYKLLIQSQLGFTDDAFSTLKIMELLKPENPDLKTMLGAYYEYHKGDTMQAKVKYNEADLLYKSIIDDIISDSCKYESIIMGYTLNLKMLGKETEANRILYDYYGEDVKEFIEPFVIKKTKEEVLIRKYFTPDGSIFW